MTDCVGKHSDCKNVVFLVEVRQRLYRPQETVRGKARFKFRHCPSFPMVSILGQSTPL